MSAPTPLTPHIFTNYTTLLPFHAASLSVPCQLYTRMAHCALSHRRLDRERVGRAERKRRRKQVLQRKKIAKVEDRDKSHRFHHFCSFSRTIFQTFRVQPKSAFDFWKEEGEEESTHQNGYQRGDPRAQREKQPYGLRKLLTEE